MSIITQPGLPEHELQLIQDRRIRLRHLGRAETIIMRDSDVMRIGLRVRLQSICASALSIISPVPFRAGEQIKVRLRNEVQRFFTELRGAVRKVESVDDGKFVAGIELFSRLMPLDVMMLRRAGLADLTNFTGRIWV